MKSAPQRRCTEPKLQKKCVLVKQIVDLRCTWMCRHSSGAGTLSSPSSLPTASLRPLSNVRDVVSSLKHGAGGRSLMAIWGIYPTFCVYLCLSVRGSAADITKGITSLFEEAAAPLGTRHTSLQIPVRHVWGQKDEKHVPYTSFGKDPGRQGGEKGSPLPIAQSLRGGTRWVVLF